MKNKTHLSILVALMLSIAGVTNANAYSIAVKNEDGVTIYYNLIGDGSELSVTYYNGDNNYSHNSSAYEGRVVIPDEVTYQNRTRKVTSIGEYAFYGCSRLTSVIIPNSITSIGNSAFHGCNITSIFIPRSVSVIGVAAFSGSSLTSVSIGNGVSVIGLAAFSDCKKLSTVTIPNSVTSIGEEAFRSCSGLTSVTLSNNITTIRYYTFAGCSNLSSVIIPNSVTSIETQAFYQCTKLTTLTIPNKVTKIGYGAFAGCNSLRSVTIPNSVTSIEDEAFNCDNISEVFSLIENPFSITGKASTQSVFSLNTIYNATLHVPAGTDEKYRETAGWKDFYYIEEIEEGEISMPEKCLTPIICYEKGKLTFNSETEGATCISTICDTDINSYSKNEVPLTVTYHISVYATKNGYEDSDVAEATLCWIDVQPQTEGIEVATNMQSIEAVPVLIQTHGPVVSITGAAEGTEIAVYDVAGRLVGSAKASVGTTDICTTLRDKDIAIVKIGSKSVKVVMK